MYLFLSNSYYNYLPLYILKQHSLQTPRGIESRGGPQGCWPKRGPWAKNVQFFKQNVQVFTFLGPFSRKIGYFSRKIFWRPFFKSCTSKLKKFPKFGLPPVPAAKPGPGAVCPLTPLSPGLQTPLAIYVHHLGPKKPKIARTQSLEQDKPGI